MKVAGFTIIRNAVKYDYPVVEAINSILPICDAFYVGVGNSEDETKKLIENINSDKIKIIDTIWDDNLRVGGHVLANETNKVFDAIPKEFNWCFYIQSDECVHEDDLNTIKTAMQNNLLNKNINGLLFKYKQFYGQYNYIGVGRRWYANEIRIIRNDKSIRSYKDAQGFRFTNNTKLKVKNTNAFIYHYGWVKPPKAQQAKQQNFHKMWHDDNWVNENVKKNEEFDYSNIDLLEIYKGTHPLVFKSRIKNADWEFIYNSKFVKTNFKYKFLYFIEKLTGWRIGENKNYIEV
mgnify:CR=1 FL=1